MHTRLLRLLPFVALAVVTAFAPQTVAQTTLYWDTNGASAGTTAPGWWTLGTNWSTTSDGTAATQAWSSGSHAVFSAGTNATGTYTVLTGNNLSASQLTFQRGSVTIADNTLTVAQGIDVTSGASATIAANLLSISNFTKSGAGTLTLAGRVVNTTPAAPFVISEGHVVLTGSGVTFTGPIAAGIDTLTFSGAAGTTFTVTNGARLAPRSLVLSDQLDLRVTSGGTVSLGSGGSLTIGSGSPTFTLAGGTLHADNSATVSPQVNLTAATTSTVFANTFGSIALNGGVAGAGSLNKTGQGTITIYGDNTGFTGGTTFTTGTVALGHANALGTGPLTFAGGSLLVQGVSPTYTPFVIQNGSATVTGGGTAGTVLASNTYIEVGNAGTGTLNIAGKGKVDAAASVVAGIGTGGNGTITVDGADSLLEVGTFFIAGYASGTTGALALTNNAAATVTQHALIGSEGSGTLAVSSNASFTTTQDLNFGFAATGSGALSVSGGGTVTTGSNAYIGYAGGSTATVSGTGSTWNIASILYTGFGATGSLTIGTGGIVSADYVDLARNAGSTGTINLSSGGTLRLGGLTQGAGNATMNLAGGTLEIANRSFTTSVPLTLAPDATSTVSLSGLAVQFDGVISGSGALAKSGAGIVTLNTANTYTGGTALNAGTLALGHVSGLGANTAPLTLNGGLLDLGTFNPTVGTAIFNGGTFSNGTLANAAAFEVRTGSLSAALTGSAALTKTGTGTFTLSGANTYTGATTVSAGTLTLGTATTLGNTASVTVEAAGTLALNHLTVALPALAGTGTVALGTGDLQFGNASDQTLAASLTGAGTLTKVGTGTLTLTGANAHTGGTRVHAGLIEVGALTPFGSAAVTLNGGGLRWAIGTAADVSTVGLSFGASGGTLDTNGSNVTLASPLGGAGGFTKTGAGTLTLSGANTYTGATTLAAGALQLGHAAALSYTARVSIETSTTLDLANLAATIPAIGGSGTLALGSGVLTTGNAANQTFSGVITGTGSITKTGAGTLALTGTNTHTNGFNLAAGLLEFSSLANLGSGLVTLNGGGLRWAAANTIDISPRLTALGADGGAFDTNGNDIAFATALSGSGAITKSGAGALTFTAANTHTGGTRVTAGLIEFDSLASFGTGAITLNGGGLRWAGGTSTDVSPRLAALGGAGVTFDTNGNNVAFATALSGPGSVTKLGTGTLTLSGANSAGSALVKAGTLAFSGATSSLVAGSYLEVGDASSDATLNLAAGHQITTAGTTAIAVGADRTASLLIDGANSILTSHGTAFLGHTGTAAIGVTNGGRLTAGAPIIIGYNANSVASVTVSGVASDSGTPSRIDTAYPVTVGEYGNANVTITDGARLIAGAPITIGYRTTSVGNLTVSAGGLVSTPSSVTLGGEATLPPFSGSSAAGSVLVTGSNSRLEVGTNLTVGNLGTGALTIAAGGTVTVGGYLLLGGALSGAPPFDQVFHIGDGTLNLNSGGTLEVGGTDGLRRSSRSFMDFFSSPQQTVTLYSDHANFSGGTIKVTGSALTTVVPAVLTNTSTIDTNGLGATFSGVFSGSGGLAKTGAGTLTLSGVNTYTGGVSLDGGTLVVSTNDALGTAAAGTTVASGATLALSGGFNYTTGEAVTLSGTGAPARNGALDNLSGNNAFAGALTLASDAQIGTSSGTQLTLSGGIGETGGTRTLTFAGAGTTVLTGASSHTGGTTLNSGILTINTGGALSASTAPLLLNGGTLNLYQAAQTLSQLSGAGGTLNLGSGHTLTVNQSSNTSYAGALAGPGGLTKAGGGTLSLSNASYSGLTHITAGRLNVTGSIGAFTVASGGTFSPGNSPGLLIVNGDLTLAGLTDLEFAATGTRGIAYDAITVNGAIAFGGTLQVTLLDSFSPVSGASFNLFDWTGSASGTFASLSLPALASGLAWNSATLYSDGILSVSTSAIPEPSTYAAIFGAAMLAMAAYRRRA